MDTCLIEKRTLMACVTILQGASLRWSRDGEAVQSENAEAQKTA